MAKLRDYNMNGIIILGVDVGYGVYKTARGLSAAKIHLAVGLPLKWVQAQRDSFRGYMMKNRHADYKYAGRRYTVDIVDCTVMPQCYAAIQRLVGSTGSLWRKRQRLMWIRYLRN